MFIFRHRRRQVVDIIQGNAGKICGRRLDIPGNGDIDEKQRTPLAGLHDGGQPFFRQDVVGRSRRSDDDIGPGSSLIALLVMDGRAGKKGGQLLCPLDMAVDDIQFFQTFA